MLPERVSVPPAAMRLTKSPEPLTLLAKVRLPERLMTRVPLLMTTADGGRAPTVPALPTCRVAPEATVVVP